MRLSQAQGLPVVARESARELGTIRSLVVDARGRRISCVEIRGDKVGLVDWDGIVGFGPDALVIESAEQLRSARDDAEEHALASAGGLAGRLVLTDGGDAAGALGDLEFDPGDGRIERLVVGGREVAGERLLTVGPYAVIVAG
jgi:sporulation protein YlmC with PRC-barrel domain